MGAWGVGERSEEKGAKRPHWASPTPATAGGQGSKSPRRSEATKGAVRPRGRQPEASGASDIIKL